MVDAAEEPGHGTGGGIVFESLGPSSLLTEACMFRLDITGSKSVTRGEVVFTRLGIRRRGVVFPLNPLVSGRLLQKPTRLYVKLR